MIFIFHVIMPADIMNTKLTRKSSYDYLKEKYPFAVLEGETDQNLEEILIDLFENEFLIDSEVQTLRKDFRSFKMDKITINEENMSEENRESIGGKSTRGRRNKDAEVLK